MKARISFIVLGMFLVLQAGSAYALTVRSADILDGEVKNADLGANAVTSSKIYDGTIETSDIADLAVTEGKIGAGAVTDSKISGFITTTHLPVGTTTGTVASGEHNHEGLYLKKYARVIVVAESGGDFSNPIDAMASISNPSDSNPYLLKIMPGVYDLGSNSLVLKPFVDVEGSGENVTLISGSNATQGLVIGASNVNVRQLSISNNGYITLSISGVSPTFSSVSIFAQSAGGNTFAIQLSGSSAEFKDVKVVASTPGTAWGIYDESSTARYQHIAVDITAGTSYGMQCISCSSALVDSSIVVGGGVNEYGVYANGAAGLTLDSVIVESTKEGYLLLGGTSTLRNVTITAGTVGVSTFLYSTLDIVRSSIEGVNNSFVGDSSTTNIALSQISGPVAPGPIYTCFQNYSGTFSPVTCP